MAPGMQPCYCSAGFTMGHQRVNASADDQHAAQSSAAIGNDAGC